MNRLLVHSASLPERSNTPSGVAPFGWLPTGSVFREDNKRLGSFNDLLQDPTPENRQIITEILKFPARLSGYSAKQHHALKMQAELTLCPVDCARRKNLDTVRGRLDTATDAFTKSVTKTLQSMRPVGRKQLKKAFGS